MNTGYTIATLTFGAIEMEQILLWAIGGLFAFTLIVPVALIIYIGAWLLFGDLREDDEKYEDGI